MRRLILTLGVLLITLALAAGAAILSPRTVSGQVRDARGALAGATVRQRASDNATTSDRDGRFELALRGLPLHQTITAWAEGYYIAAADVSFWRREAVLELRPHTTVDHPGRDWLPSDANPDVDLACGNCHKDLHADWRADAHAGAATNPLVQAMYLGSDAEGRPGVGPGFRLDEPGAAGNCAFCHAPAAASLAQLEGEAANGVFCQFCHSIAHARQPYAETTAGVKAIALLRPPPGEHLFIGPYDDVPGRDTYSALQKDSQFCAPCHSGSWWDVPTYTSFAEWQASDYAAAGVQCQDCHMVSLGQAGDPAVQLVSACAPQEPGPIFGETLCKLQACIECHFSGQSDVGDPSQHPALIPGRDPATVSNHRMRGAGDADFLRGAVELTLDARQSEKGVLAEVKVANAGAGHHIPTDGWMRNMVLLVSADGAGGQPLAYVGKEVVPDWGGVGAAAEGNYAGLPGRGFARVLEDWEGESPAPPWRNGVHVLSDTRIPANAADRSSWLFASPEGGQPARVTARLVYRRTFKPWSDAKGFEDEDIILAESTVRARLASFTPPAPEIARAFAPSALTTATGERIADSLFAPAAACGECHPPQAQTWSASGHAISAQGPLYKAWFKVANENSNGEMAAFCAGCHTPIGLASGQIRSRWGWVGQESRPLSAAALEGVTCDVCHLAAGVAGARDGALVLSAANRPDPHAATGEAAPALDIVSQPALCGTCHEAVNPASGLAVMTTFSEWQASPFNSDDAAKRRTCQDCHFGEGEHGQLTQADLAGVVEIEILPATALTAGQENTLQIEVRNVGAGHSLPTGASELRQVWLSLLVSDAAGREIYRSGEVDDFGDPRPGSVTYGVDWLDGEGEPTNRLWEAASIQRDHRVPAGGSLTETFEFTVPADAAEPLRAEATLNYRRASGYLSALMSIYVQEDIPAPATILLARTSASLPVERSVP